MKDIFQLLRLGFNLPKNESIPNLNIRNEFGQNLLHEAIAHKNHTAAVDLIKNKINVNQQDNNGLTPLHYCAEYNDVLIAKIILENKGDLSIENAYGNTPLWTAVFNSDGRYDLVQLFMNYGANSRKKNKNNKSPLDFALQIGDNNLIKLLE